VSLPHTFPKVKRGAAREAVNVALWLRRGNGWITIACALLIPISLWTGRIDSVRFISLITVIGLALGSLSACTQPESRSKRWRLVTLLRVCV
jgi:hypothetical protein